MGFELWVENLSRITNHELRSFNIERRTSNLELRRTMPRIELKHINQFVLRDINLTIEDGELLEHRVGLPLRPDPRRVDEQVLLAAVVDVHVHRVAGRAGDLGGDDALEARQRVDEGGLPHVGASHHGDAGEVGGFGGRVVPDPVRGRLLCEFV